MDAAPVIARGRSLAVFVPPMAAAAAPCLQAIPDHRPTLVLTADGDRAVALADACARPATLAVTGLARAQRRLAAGLPDFVFVSAHDALKLLTQSRLPCASFQTVVLAWPEQLDDDGREALGAVMAEAAKDSQRMILTAAPGAALDELLQRYAFKAVTFGFPAPEEPAPPPVGPASYVLARASQLEPVRRRILDALDPDSDDAIVIAPCPASREDAAALAGRRAVFVVETSQLAWLARLFSPLTPVRLPTSLDALEQRAEAVRARLARTLEHENLERELFLIGPLLERYDPAEVAAAALRLAGGDALAQTAEGVAAHGARATESNEIGAATGIPSWARLWVGVGRKDNVRPGDLLGAIVGESGLPADHIGRIEVKELYCLVEVHPEDAERVIRSLSGTSLRGRRVMARFDRGHGPHRGGPGSGRRGAPPAPPAPPASPMPPSTPSPPDQV